MIISHDNHLNFFRLLFALQVVFFHSQGWLNLPMGGVMSDLLALFPGVPLFFLVSGFLITDSYLNSSNLKEYFIKRGLRIYPALFINILILEFAMYIGGNMVDNTISIIQYIIYFFSYVATATTGIASNLAGMQASDIYNYNGFFHNYPSGVLWTLSVELNFYLILPLMLFMKNVKLRNSILAILAIVALAISSQASKEFYETSKLHILLSISVFPYLWIFIIGMVIRLYWTKIKVYFADKGLYYLSFYLFFCLISSYFFGELGNYRTELYIITVLQTILMSFAMFGLAFSYTDIKFNRKLDLSYSTYLYHMLIVQILMSLNMTGKGYLYFIVIGATFVIAYLSWTYVEKPMLRLKMKK